MPRHWRPIDPDNPGPGARVEQVRKIVEDTHHGKLIFCGREDGARLWWALVDVKHVADAVLYMASLPLDANVPFITVMANQMPFMGRG